MTWTSFNGETSLEIRRGDALTILRSMPADSVHCCVTSPPYWGLRDYGCEGQIGLEQTPEAYVAKLVEVFREVRRVLRDDGVVFLNLGDSYYQPASRGQRGQSCGIGGKASEGSQVSGCSSQSLHGAHRDAWWTRTEHSGSRHVLEPIAEPLSRILGYMRLLTDHLPIGDCSRQPELRQSVAATLDLARSLIPAVEQLRAFRGSMPDESWPQPQGHYHLLDMLSACLVSLRSFVDDAQGCAHTMDDDAGTPHCRTGTALPCAALGRRTQYTYGCCLLLASWLEVAPFQPQCTTEQTFVSSLKPKDLVGIPWRVAFALQADGWWLRSDIIWSKPNPMPESVTDRPTKAHEYVFLLAKSERYYYDAEAVAEPISPATITRLGEPNLAAQTGSSRAHAGAKSNGAMKAVPPRFGGSKYGGSADEAHRTKSGNEYTPADALRNRRTVWTIATQPYAEAHFAVFPPALVEPCILAGCPVGGTVIDPFCGSGTTLLVAQRHGRNAIGIELNPAYCQLARERLAEHRQMRLPMEVRP